MERDYNLVDLYMNAFPNSRDLYRRALKIFPSGVTHDSRFLKPYPIYVTHAAGSKKWDEDGNEYIDYWAGHGALLLGHCHPAMVQAVSDQLRRGTHLGACHRLEIEWGELVMQIIPSAERVRFTSSGTEATMMTLRLARTYTGKNKVIKFAGHFHGWNDPLIIGANPPYEAPPPGIPKGFLENTIVCPPNDIEAVERVLSEDRDVACVILEPTGASFGVIPTSGDFLKALRDLTRRHGVLLIFDEVITGFRISPGGAQEYYGVLPDLTALAKILAGGLPGGAVCGRREIMELLEIKDDEEWKLKRKMYHPGTYNANPLSASAGIATLKIVKTGEPCQRANELAAKLRKGMNEVIDSHGLRNWCVYGEFSGFKYLLNHDCDLRGRCDYGACKLDYRKLKGANPPELSHALRCAMLLNGVDAPAVGGMTTAAHTEEDIEKTCEAFDRSIDMLKRSGLI
ncbi:aspartate aminotransferase family protein [Candidatus Poribacteria bacterium]|nr:aspartate aminotransferase family protein [Candidatus Poribacteria bacterium]